MKTRDALTEASVALAEVSELVAAAKNKPKRERGTGEHKAKPAKRPSLDNKPPKAAKKSRPTSKKGTEIDPRFAKPETAAEGLLDLKKTSSVMKKRDTARKMAKMKAYPNKTQLQELITLGLLSKEFIVSALVEALVEQHTDPKLAAAIAASVSTSLDGE